MPKTITITEQEIIENSNNTELGNLIRQRYYQLKKIDEDIHDVCLICGKKTPYLKTTHIDFRVNYVKGVGQNCYQPNICEK